MPRFERRHVVNYIARLLFSLLLGVPLLWANGVLAGASALTAGVVIATVASAIRLDKRRWLPALLVIAVGVVAYVIGVGGAADANTVFLRTLYAITIGLLAIFSAVYQQDKAAFKVAGIAFGTILALVMLEIGSGVLLQRSQQIASAVILPSATPEPPTAVPATITPTTPAPEATLTPTLTVTPTVIATLELSPTGETTQTATPDIMPTKTGTQPVAGYGVVDWIVDNGQAPWSEFTGYGPRINSTAHAYMYDANLNPVYDHNVEFNSAGMRGPEPTYDKPEDTYRILVIGDSFVEAIQVDYAQTFYALMKQDLDKHVTPKRKFEVLALGRMGWGTLQEFLYYEHEGYKYHADLVMLMFYINDVADNNPKFFYPGINDTNYDFIFENDDVRIVDTNGAPPPSNISRKLYDALPDVLKQSNTARFAIRVFDPPQKAITPGGIMTRVHPQFYIYVSQPEMEGYSEAWQRTAWGLTHLAQSVKKNGGQLAVVSIFIGDDMVQNVSQWFPDLVKGWQWDSDLPDKRLAEILKDQHSGLIRTRPYYEAYAKQVGGKVYDLMFLQVDGHFNTVGHQVTAQALVSWLTEQGIVGQ